MQLNIIKTNREHSCFVCSIPTRLILIQAHGDFPMCMDCLLMFAALCSTASEMHEHEMLDPALIERHLNN